MDWTWLSEFTVETGLSQQRQLAAFLRDAVRTGRIAPGTVLPPLRELAERCGVNYFSAQLATRELTETGELFKKPGRGGGMRVPESLESESTVAILHIREELDGNGSAFQFLLIDRLSSELEAERRRFMIFHDQRDVAMRDTVPPMLAEAILTNRIQAVIALSVPEEAVGWFSRLPIPHTSLDLCGSDAFTSAEPVRRLLQSGKFHRPCLAGAFSFSPEALLTEAGFPADLWIAPPRGIKLEVDAARWGFECVRAVLARADRPDLLVVSYDVATTGAAQAILAAGVRVPEDLTVCFHRNRGIRYFVPFPVVFFETDVRAIVLRLIESVSTPIQQQQNPKNKQKGKVEL